MHKRRLGNLWSIDIVAKVTKNDSSIDQPSLQALFYRYPVAPSNEWTVSKIAAGCWSLQTLRETTSKRGGEEKTERKILLPKDSKSTKYISAWPISIPELRKKSFCPRNILSWVQFFSNVIFSNCRVLNNKKRKKKENVVLPFWLNFMLSPRF